MDPTTSTGSSQWHRMCLIPKPHSWQHTLSANQTEPLQWKLGDLPREFRDKLKVEKRIASLKACFYCGTNEEEAKLWACTRCVEIGSIAAYYCSRNCQKLDWIGSHKLNCGFLVPLVTNQPSKRPRHKIAGDMKLRLEAIHSVLLWASQMILKRHNLVKTNTRVIFMFKDITTLSDRWELQFVGMSKIEETTENPSDRTEENNENEPIYTTYFGETPVWNRRIDNRPLVDCGHLSSYVPQWPWLLAQVCAMRNKSDWIAKQRLLLLLAAIQDAAPLSPFEKWRDSFQAPDMRENRVWKLSKVARWERKMGLSLCI